MAHGRRRVTEAAGGFNHARFVFLNPRTSDFYGDRGRAANDTMAILRFEAGREADERVFTWTTTQ